MIVAGHTIQQTINGDPSDTERSVEGIEGIGSDVPVTGDYGQQHLQQYGP